MKPEDLFAAIGGLEAGRLERSELTMEQSSRKEYVEEPLMYQKKTKTRRFANILVAALIVTMLATTVFAAAGFILYENPKQMITALFGSRTGADSADWVVTDYKGDPVQEYHSERAPADESAAEELAPLVDPVGQSIAFAGHTLTVDANLYDAATKCGIVTYTIENPEGIRPYTVEPDGEVFFPYGELFTANQYGRSFIIPEKCTDTRLCAAYYYQTRNPQTSNLEIRISFWAAIEDPEAFLNQGAGKVNKHDLADSAEKIVISADTSSGVQSVGFGGKVTVSPFSVQVDLKALTEEETPYIRELKLTFRDGTEYVVKDDSTVNYRFDVGESDCSEETMMMNRLVDVEKVAAVTVNGVEISAEK